MKVWAYKHPELNILCCALLQNAVPSNVVSYEFDVEDTSDIILDNGIIRTKTSAEKLAEKKVKQLQSFSDIITNHITKNYPDVKQRSDLSDKENGESYILLKGIDTINFRKDIADIVISLYPNFTSALDAIKQKYNDANNDLVNYWIEQLLKVAFRQYFIFLCKQEFYRVKGLLMNATDEAQFPEINLPNFPEGL
ncbi:MAG: hypothetical protein ACP5PT_00810 [Brevinematia bacterium]